MKTEYTQEQALNKMRSGKNIFLTGLPGTGKSYIIRQFIQEQEQSGKQVLVCAPTGIAALNVNGITMHQAFGIPIPAYGHYIHEIANSKVKAALTADIIIIDEISMCRNDVFEYFGYVIDYVKKQNRNPQIIVVGDMFQLPPVVPETEVSTLKAKGFDPSGYCFTSRYWNKMKFVPVVLTKVMRQADEIFIQNLNLLRNGDITCMHYFNQRVIDDESIDSNGAVINICSTNAKAQEINDNELAKLDSPKCLYTMKKEKFCPKETIAEENLVLKEGARIMFIANDVIGKQYTNGEMGTVALCLDNYVRVLKDSGEEITVFPYKWRVYNVKTSGAVLSKNEVGNYTQLPLKLGYCVTMHKTQGQTYDSAIVTPSSFACGQLYVALSRVKSYEGLYLTQPISAGDIKVNDMVSKFYETFSYDVSEKNLEKRKKLESTAAKKAKTKKSKKKTTTKKPTTKKTASKTTTKTTKQTNKTKSATKPATKKNAVKAATKTTKNTSKKSTKKKTTTKKKGK